MKTAYKLALFAYLTAKLGYLAVRVRIETGQWPQPVNREFD